MRKVRVTYVCGHDGDRVLKIDGFTPVYVRYLSKYRACGGPGCDMKSQRVTPGIKKQIRAWESDGQPQLDAHGNLAKPGWHTDPGTGHLIREAGNGSQRTAVSTSSGDSNRGQRWSREELILAFNLYCRTPFGRMHMRNREVMALARALGRSPGAVSYKLVNFARLDPALQARGIRGMSHGAKGDLEVWKEFATDGEALAYESEMLLAQLERRDLEETIDTSDLEGIDGRERAAIVRVRVNQSYFRRMVLARYSNTCCVTGLRIPELLVASHIMPWADAPEHRMNPRNGLCLNALHDRAFDRGLLTVSDDLRVRVASVVRTSGAPAASDLLTRFDDVPLRLPEKFAPAPKLLAYHREHVFRG